MCRYRAPPPAAQLAAQRLHSDAAAITLYGERVAFVVVYGPPGARLKDCVMPPLEVEAGAITKPTASLTNAQVIAKGGSVRPNAVYYITKCIVPSLQRVLGLAGADVEQW